MTGIYHIALIRALSRDLGMSMPAAVPLAERMLSTDGGEVTVGEWLALRLDQRTFQRDLDHAIADAVESVAPARRGRPPKPRE